MTARTERIVEMRRAGATLQVIGDEVDLTRERVRQILAEEGISGRPWPGYKLVHYRRLAKAVEIIARRIIADAKPGDEHFPHGTTNGYMRGCTCDACRGANRERVYAYTGVTVKNPRPHQRGALTDGTRRAAIYYRRARS